MFCLLIWYRFKMSRVGNSPISIPQGLDVSIDENHVIVKSNKIESKVSLSDGIEAKLVDDKIVFSRPSESKNHKAKHGLYRALVNNAVEGLSKGFVKMRLRLLI